MIDFFSETDFQLINLKGIRLWISDIISSEGFEEGDITYVFCDDEYLNRINIKFLDHDTLTDIISFDNSIGKQVHGEIYISTDRVQDNAKDFKVTLEDELHRVMIHGVLHFCGYNDKTQEEKQLIRKRENKALARRIFV